MRVQAMTLTPKDIETQCEDAACDGTVLRVIWSDQVPSYGFVDLDSRVLPWARPYQLAARRGFVRGRRFFLDEERSRARFAAMRQSPSAT
jgi:hypothetical protein